MEQPTRLGCQTPTKSVTLPYTATLGQDAIDAYERTGRTAQEWQKVLLFDICSVRDDGLWMHTKYGYSIPRRNGKNEVVSIRELYGLLAGERILHTAHRVTTSSSAAARLAALLNEAGYEEVTRPKKDGIYNKHYTYAKQMGLEKITILSAGGGYCSFRTRTAKGGLGEGFDLLVIDEAQEYTKDQESSLKYVVSDSKNPQTVYCGTPPTAVSTGDVFAPMRDNVLFGDTENTGWAEWSVDEMSDPKDRELWYQCNPSLGTIISERSIADEIGSDTTDFNIQRLGLWLKLNQRSVITEQQWDELLLESKPKLTGKMHIGIKYGADGTNVSMSVAVRTTDSRVFVEAIDCRSKRAGDDWIINFLQKAQKNIAAVVIDGKVGTEILAQEMREAKLKIKPIIPTLSEYIQANSMFENGLEAKLFCHMGQPSLRQSATNCDRRPIASNGGFGYKSILEGADISLLDSVILAQWACQQTKEKPKRKIVY